MIRTYPELLARSLRRELLQSQKQAAASCETFPQEPQTQCSASFELSGVSKSRITVLRSASATSSSSKIGSETTYFSVAQLPRSRSRQSSLQKGKSASLVESVAVLQMGHLCCMKLFLLGF